MKRKVMIVASVLAAVIFRTGAFAEEPRIAVFADSVKAVAKEKNITIEQAVSRLKRLGVTGFDASFKSPLVPQLVKAGMTAVNLYGHVDLFDQAKTAETTDRFLSVALKYGVKTVMILPPMFTGKDADKDAEVEKMIAGFRYFAKAARAKGVVPTIEDFGFANNVCSYSVYIRRILTQVPELDFTADSGNLYCIAREQEDIISLSSALRSRIRHVHLKDYDRGYKPGDSLEIYETIGMGAIDCRKFVEVVSASGYSGWYTLECPAGDDVFADIARQTAVLKVWLEMHRSTSR